VGARCSRGPGLQSALTGRGPARSFRFGGGTWRIGPAARPSHPDPVRPAPGRPPQRGAAGVPGSGRRERFRDTDVNDWSPGPMRTTGIRPGPRWSASRRPTPHRRAAPGPPGGVTLPGERPSRRLLWTRAGLPAATVPPSSDGLRKPRSPGPRRRLGRWPAARRRRPSRHPVGRRVFRGPRGDRWAGDAARHKGPQETVKPATSAARPRSPRKGRHGNTEGPTARQLAAARQPADSRQPHGAATGRLRQREAAKTRASQQTSGGAGTGRRRAMAVLTAYGKRP
jgi:hypothetical protein